jgi:hypothetical protein
VSASSGETESRDSNSHAGLSKSYKRAGNSVNRGTRGGWLMRLWKRPSTPCQARCWIPASDLEIRQRRSGRTILWDATQGLGLVAGRTASRSVGFSPGPFLHPGNRGLGRAEHPATDIVHLIPARRDRGE